jgi:hypothetical protein
MGQTNRNLESRFREHIRYIKNNDPHSAYALHKLNSRHEYSTINDTMMLIKQVNNPSLLLPYEQMYIQSLMSHRACCHLLYNPTHALFTL